MMIFALLLQIAAQDPVSASSGLRASEVTISYAAGNSPTAVLGLDNNLDICLATTAPQSLDSLAARGIRVTGSQRMLLLASGILERSANGWLRCRIPVFRPPASNAIRDVAEEIADSVSKTLHGDFLRFGELLNARGFASQAFAITSSLVLDGLAWEELTSLGALGSDDPMYRPTGSPLWTGVAWITLPSSNVAKVGTNTYNRGTSTLYLTWTPTSEATVRPIVASESMRTAIFDLAEDRATDSSHKDRLDVLGVTQNGRLAIPVFLAGDTVVLAARDLARRTAENYLRLARLHPLGSLTGIPDEATMTLVLYHEVYPRLIRALGTPGSGVSRSQMPPTGVAGAMFLLRR